MQLKKLIEALLFLAISIGCGLLLNLVTLRDAYMQVLGVSAGGILLTICLMFAYLKTGEHYTEHGLKILDFILVAASLGMIGAFQWLGAEPYLWILCFFVPCVLIRAVVTYYSKKARQRERANNRSIQA